VKLMRVPNGVKVKLMKEKIFALLAVIGRGGR
jgi:hypothetical protein